MRDGHVQRIYPVRDHISRNIKAIALSMARDSPDRFISNMSQAKRQRPIFIEGF